MQLSAQVRATKGDCDMVTRIGAERQERSWQIRSDRAARKARSHLRTHIRALDPGLMSGLLAQRRHLGRTSSLAKYLRSRLSHDPPLAPSQSPCHAAKRARPSWRCSIPVDFPRVGVVAAVLNIARTSGATHVSSFETHEEPLLQCAPLSLD
jgi:hypothetical protein